MLYSLIKLFISISDEIFHFSLKKLKALTICQSDFMNRPQNPGHKPQTLEIKQKEEYFVFHLDCPVLVRHLE